MRVKRRKWLPVLLGLLCLAGLGAPPGHAAVAAGAAGPAERAGATTLSAAEFESRLVARTNARREARGCRPLRLHAALTLAARQHSARMADARQLSHRLSGEADLGTRVSAAGYTNWRIVAENLAWGQETPAAVFRAWIRSPGHRANIDNCRLRHVGIGVELRGGRPWVTQDLGRRWS